MKIVYIVSIIVVLIICGYFVQLYLVPDDSQNPFPNPIESRNFVMNPSFSYGGKYWDLRPGTGPDPDRGNLGIIDKWVYRTEPASLKVVPSENACNTGECDRTVWQDYKIPLNGGEVIKLSGWVGFESCCNSPGCTSSKPCWVNPTVAGNTKQGLCNGKPYCDRGGARLGMDIRDKYGNLIDFDMRIADWTMEPNSWHYLEMVYHAPKEARSVIVWIQGFEYNAPASVWLDDVSLTILN